MEVKTVADRRATENTCLSPPSGTCRLNLPSDMTKGESKGLSVRVTLSQFLEQLFEESRVTVSSPEPLSADETRAADATLAALEAVYRLDLPGEAPPLVPAAARWAATSLFQACQFVAFRNAGEEMIAAALGTPKPTEAAIHAQKNGLGGPSCNAAALHYSVDLTFRFLPDLTRLARSDAENDPLLGYLRQWASDWPLSSVGLADVTPSSIEPIANHPCLLGMYCDRIIARKDRSRLGDPRVNEAVQQAVGENEIGMTNDEI